MIKGIGGVGPIIAGGSRLREAVKSVTFAVSNDTESKVVFTVTGVVQVSAIYGVVTTAISSNHTAGHLRLNDQGATIDITEAVTGVTLSSLAAGTLIYKEGLAAVALQLKSAAAGFFEEPAAAGTASFSPFIVGKKSGAVTTIDYRYTSTNTPATGAIRFAALWIPLSADGNLA